MSFDASTAAPAAAADRVNSNERYRSASRTTYETEMTELGRSSVTGGGAAATAVVASAPAGSGVRPPSIAASITRQQRPPSITSGTLSSVSHGHLTAD